MNRFRQLLVELLKQDSFPLDAISFKEKIGSRNLVLYGAGEASHLFLEIITEIFGFKPILILDKKFTEEEIFHGVRACSLDGCNLTIEQKQSSLVVISTGSLEAFSVMRSAAYAKGFGEVISMMDIYEIHNPFSEPPELYLEGYQFFKKNALKILEIFELLEDDLSKEIYYGVLRNHLTRKPKVLPMRLSKEHNFPLDLPFTIDYTAYVMCGADNHQLSNAISLLSNKLDQIVVIDPMIDSFEFTDTSLNIIMVPCALSDKEDILPFTRESEVRSTTYGCRLIHSGESLVKTTRLDTILGSTTPTFISMDIEGSEFNALQGGARKIQESKPTLAICLYHSVNHLWEIPFFIKQLSADYRFWIRNYSSFTSETVLYAHPHSYPQAGLP